MAAIALTTAGLVALVVALLAVPVVLVFEAERGDTFFGLDNPADTGMAYGFLAPLLVMAEARGLNIECRPMFLESGLRGTCNVMLHVRPLSVVGAVMAFLASPAVIRAAAAAWRART